MAEVLEIVNNKESVIIVLHEIYGINQHMKMICEQYSMSGYDVICPGFIKLEDSFDYYREEEAYQYFTKRIGFNLMAQEVKKILRKAKTNYKHVFLLGFSVGATTAWICSDEENLVDGIICYYGSRIRDYKNITPQCPILLLFADQEKSVNITELASILEEKKHVRVHILNGKHGFSDPFSKNYNDESYNMAKDIVDDFIIKIRNEYK